MVRTVLAILFVGLLVFFVSKNWGQFKESLALVRGVSPCWLVLEAGLYALSVFFSAVACWILTLKKVNFRHLLWLEWAASSVNRVLPAGAGNIGMHAVYLTKHRHTLAQSTAVVSVNNALGASMHLLALGLVILFSPQLVTGLNVHFPVQLFWVIGGLIVLLGVLLLTPRVQRKVSSFLSNFAASLMTYEHAPHKIVLGALASIGVTTCNMLIFVTALHAVGVSLSILQIFVIYSIGLVFGNAAPTPGGLGGVEVGLTAGLVAKGVQPELALAGALTFRLMTYVMPLTLGTFALVHVRRRKLL